MVFVVLISIKWYCICHHPDVTTSTVKVRLTPMSIPINYFDAILYHYSLVGGVIQPVHSKPCNKQTKHILNRSHQNYQHFIWSWNKEGQHQMLWSNVIVYILLTHATACDWSLVPCCLLSCLSHSCVLAYIMQCYWSVLVSVSMLQTWRRFANVICW